MAKKSKDKVSDKQLAAQITDSAQEIWLAGLAAFEQTQKEGGKLFDSLVKEGKKVEARTQELTSIKLEEIIGELRARASGTWGKLEKVFEERMAQAFGQLGIPRNEDLQKVAGRLEKLESSVKALDSSIRSAAEAAATPSAPSAPSPKTAAKRTRSRSAKPAAKPAAKDNLKRIAGLGRAFEKQLNQHGITTFRQVAELTDQDLEKLEAAGIKIASNVRKENWIAQAKEQHFKKYNEKL